MSGVPFSLDPYRSADSYVHQLDARIKLVLTLAFILATALLPVNAWAAFILLLSLAWSCALLSTLGIAFVVKRALVVLPFGLAALPLPFSYPSDVTWQVDMGFVQLTIGQAGLVRLIGITLKSWLSVQAAVMLSASTRLPELLMALRAIRLPRLLVAVIGLMWRYLFVLVEEAARLLRARQARSGTSAHAKGKIGGSLFWRAKVTGEMAGGLFLRSIERSERVYAAMLARGYDGTPRVLEQSPLRRKDWLLMASVLLILFLLLLLGVFLGGI